MNASVQISDFSLGGGSNELKAQTNWKVNFLSQFVPRMLFYQVEIPGNKCSNLKNFRSSTVHWIYDLCLFSAKQLNWYLWLSLILDGNKHYVSKFQAIVPKPYACESSFLMAVQTTTTCSYIASPQAYPCLFKGLSAKHLHMAVPPAQLWEADNKLHLCANNSSSFGFCSFCSITLVFKKINK